MAFPAGSLQGAPPEEGGVNRTDPASPRAGLPAPVRTALQAHGGRAPHSTPHHSGHVATSSEGGFRWPNPQRLCPRGAPGAGESWPWRRAACLPASQS